MNLKHTLAITATESQRLLLGICHLFEPFIPRERKTHSATAVWVRLWKSGDQFFWGLQTFNKEKKAD